MAQPISHLTLLECLDSYSLQTYSWRSTSLHSVLSAFSSCNNYAVCDARSTMTPSPHWRMHLPQLHRLLSVSWLVLLRRQQTSCNASSTWLCRSYQTAVIQTKCIRSAMPDCLLGMLFLTFSSATLSVSTFRRQLKHYFSFHQYIEHVCSLFKVNASHKLLYLPTFLHCLSVSSNQIPKFSL